MYSCERGSVRIGDAMKYVGMNVEMLNAVIERRYERGVEQLLDAWHELAADNRTVSAKPIPDRSTIYRWLNTGSLPRSKEHLMGFCRLLDIDPLCVLEASDNETEKALEYLLVSLQLEHWKQPALEFLAEYFGRQKSWPPPSIAKHNFGRSWYTAEIEHDPKIKSLFYAKVRISGNKKVYTVRPQVYHIAFCSPGFFWDRWLQYGLIVRHRDQLNLYHINGHNQAVQTFDVDKPFHFETWFGPSRTTFRLASLHPFQAELDGDFDIGDDPLRFPT